MLESFKTTGRIAADIIRGRALPETLVPNMRNHVELVITRANGDVEYVDGWNARTTSGAVWQTTTMGSSSLPPANWIALGNQPISAALSDYTLASEIVSGANGGDAGDGGNYGLARAEGTFTFVSASSALYAPATYKIYNQFLSTQTTTVQSAALFTGPVTENSYYNPGSGTPVPIGSANNFLFVEANLYPVAVLASGDSIALTWSINI
jgi:hypothetical protein